jgi:hypothetical protein
MPLGDEFAMLYAFLVDPDGQVDPPLRATYRQHAPLREMWRSILVCLTNQLGLEPEKIENMILFRMGNAWLYRLAKALESKNVQRAEELKQQLEGLLSRSYFACLSIGE